MKLYVVPHSHIDVEWYWTAQDLTQMLPQMFDDSLLPAMERDDALCFAQDQAVIWQMLFDNVSAAQKQLMLRKVKEGKLEPVGGNYVQPEVQEPCGESLIRQLQIGQKWMEENLGRRARCAWHTDAFGQVNQLPQIFLQAGFDSFVFMRDIHDSDDPESFPTEFFFEGADGSRILSHWLRISYVLCESEQDGRHFIVANIMQPENEAQELRYVFRQLLETDSLQHKTGLALLPWGGDVYALKESSDKIKDRILRAAAEVGLTLTKEQIIVATPSEFFEELRKKQHLLPVKGCDFNPPRYRQDLRGTYMTRVGLKQKNRKAEQALLSCESLYACAGKSMDNDDELWKKVLFGQFHDTIGGSCIDEAYIAAMERDEQVVETAKSRIDTVLGKTDGGKVLNVYNPTQFTRSEVVTIAAPDCRVRTADGTQLPAGYDAETGKLSVLVPEIGPYETISLYAQDGTASVPKATQALENEHYLVRLDSVTGDLIAITDKQTGEELLRGCGNVIVAQEEKDPDMEGAIRLTGKCWRDDETAAESIVLEQTDIGCRAVVHKRLLGFELEKIISLTKGKKQVDFTTNILNYPGTDLMIGAEFVFDMDRPQSVYETPFAVQTGRQGLYCAQKWAGLREKGKICAIMNQGACAYWVKDNALQLGLLRAHSNFAEYGKYGTDRGLARFADGKSHTQLAAEKGNHSFSYSLVSAQDDVSFVSAQAKCLNVPLEAAWSDNAAKISSPVCEVDAPFVITKLMAAEQGLYLRGYNASEKMTACTVTLADVPKKVDYVNLLGDLLGAADVEGNRIDLKLRPFEIVTLQIIGK